MLAPGYFEQQAPIAAAENGISVELAKKYLSLIGDTPEFDPSDPEHAVVSDEQGHEIARIKWPVGAASTPVR